MKHAGFTLIELLVVVAVIAILAAIGVPNFLEAQVRTKVARNTHDMVAVRAAIQAYYADHDVYPPNQYPFGPFLEKAAQRKDLSRFLTRDLMAPYDEEEIAALLAADDVPEAEEPKAPDTPAPEPPPSFDDMMMLEEEILQSMMMPQTSGSGHLLIMTRSGYSLSAVTTPIAYYGNRFCVDTFADTIDLPVAYVNLYALRDVADEADAKFLTDARYYLMSYGPDADQAGGTRSNFGDMTNPVYGPFIDYDPTNGAVSQGDLLIWGGQRP